MVFFVTTVHGDALTSNTIPTILPIMRGSEEVVSEMVEPSYSVGSALVSIITVQTVMPANTRIQ